MSSMLLPTSGCPQVSGYPCSALTLKAAVSNYVLAIAFTLLRCSHPILTPDLLLRSFEQPTPPQAALPSPKSF